MNGVIFQIEHEIPTSLNHKVISLVLLLNGNKQQMVGDEVNKANLIHGYFVGSLLSWPTLKKMRALGY